MKKYLLICITLFCLPLFSIAQSMSLSITGHNPNCNGSADGSINITANGGTAPYSYTWSPAVGNTDSVSGLSAGTYSVTVTDGSGTSAAASVTITQPAPLTVTIDSIVVSPCFKPTGGACGTCANILWAIVNGGTPPYSYLWTPGDVTTDTLTSACYITYTVFVTDSHNCTVTDSLNITIPELPADESVNQLSAAAINAYPNPATSQLNIDLAQPITHNSTISVYDIVGRKVLAQNLPGSSQHIKIDVASLANGTYFLTLTGDDVRKTTRFSIAH